MEVFAVVFFKIVSILLSVIIGFIAGKFFRVERDSIASLLFYFIAPIVFFATPANTTLSLTALSITALVFVLCALMCLIAYHLFGLYWQDNTRNILAFSAGTSNCGYFMLPIATAIFDDHTLGVYMMGIVGVSLYESSVGFYISASSVTSTKENLKRIIKQPNLNAFALGCLISIMGITLPDFLDDFIYNMRSTYSILGMVMVGLGLSTLEKFDIDVKFTLAAVSSKCILQPLLINTFILLDKWLFHLYKDAHYYALYLLAVAPMGANTIVISSLLKFYPERVATAVLISALIDLFYVPLIVSIFLVES